MRTWLRRAVSLVGASTISIGMVAAVPFAPAAHAAEVLLDGGFEAATGSPPVSPSWTEADSITGASPGSPLCDAPYCTTGSGTAGPRSGTKWAWFGGYPSGNAGHTASLAQTVTIPAGQANLSYYYRNGVVSSPFTATLTVKIDSTVVKTHTEASSAESAYALQTVDVSSFADGGTHTVSFSYQNPTAGANNMTVDDVSLTVAVTATPTVAAVAPGSPNASTTPKVKGAAEAGSTVKLYGTSTCAGSPLGTGSAADFAGAGITATVPKGTTTTFYAKASKAGQADSACSSTFVSYAQKDPDTVLTKTPAKKVKTTKKKAKVAFEFTSTLPAATFECSVDDGAYTACASGQTFKLKLGKHTFAVRAVASGVVDPTPATFSLKIKRKH